MIEFMIIQVLIGTYSDFSRFEFLFFLIFEWHTRGGDH